LNESGEKTMTVDTKKMEQFLGQFVTDLGATVHAGMVVIGERLGLYKALAASPLTPKGTGRHHPHRRALCARVAVLLGGGRLYHI
jgi:hypothetical protein